MLIFLVLLLFSGSTHSSVLRVPQEYPTIQSALDSLANGDTILVTVGVYHESLLAPLQVDFSLFGDTVPDTGDYPRPVVDPSPLPGSDSLACLELQWEDDVSISDFVFRNGPEMYPRVSGGNYGGIINTSANLTVTRCLFDSTDRGIAISPGRLVIRNSTMIDCQEYCILKQSGGLNFTHIFDCYFSARGSFLVEATDSSIIDNCWFQENQIGGAELLWLEGAGITVRNCTFGMTDVNTYLPIITYSSRGCIFENNCFCGFTHLRHASIEIHADCSSDDTTYIRNNVFEDNFTVPGYQGCMGVRVRCSDGGSSAPVVIEDNLFSHIEGGQSDAVDMYSGAVLRNNIFEQDRSPGKPMVLIQHFVDNVIFSNNYFENIQYALYSQSDSLVGAAFNWWGDSSGPYHITNPTGLGDTIVGDVQFIPWLDSGSVSIEDPKESLVPMEWKLSAYPNPFNSVVTLELSIPNSGKIRFEILNLLGRRVEERTIDGIAPQVLLSFDAAALTSGIYFVRAAPEENRKFAVMTKIVLLK